MLDRKKWEKIESRFNERFADGVFNYRPKTLKALEKLCERIPDQVLDSLFDNLLIASESTQGANPHDPTKPYVIVWLADRLESESQDLIDFAVAKQFACVHFKHHEIKRRTEIYLKGLWIGEEGHESGDLVFEVADIKEDQLLREWGYERPAGWGDEKPATWEWSDFDFDVLFLQEWPRAWAHVSYVPAAKTR